jgi:hypothetical protein
MTRKAQHRDDAPTNAVEYTVEGTVQDTLR